MRVIVVGLGIQGKKRLAIAGKEAVTTVDPVSTDAQYRSVEQVPLEEYDAALVCTPDGAKLAILRHLLQHGKHVLVEKPLIGEKPADLSELDALARANRAVCYTAYNHRFEPHIVNLKKILDSGRLGKIHSARFFYGNGTARDARNYPWRDQGFLRIDGAELRRALPAAILGQMDRDHLVGQALEIERDAHPVGGGRTEISVELHDRPPGGQSQCHGQFTCGGAGWRYRRGRRAAIWG